MRCVLLGLKLKMFPLALSLATLCLQVVRSYESCMCDANESRCWAHNTASLVRSTESTKNAEQLDWTTIRQVFRQSHITDEQSCQSLLTKHDGENGISTSDISRLIQGLHQATAINEKMAGMVKELLEANVSIAGSLQPPVNILASITSILGEADALLNATTRIRHEGEEQSAEAYHRVANGLDYTLSASIANSTLHNALLICSIADCVSESSGDDMNLTTFVATIQTDLGCGSWRSGTAAQACLPELYDGEAMNRTATEDCFLDGSCLHQLFCHQEYLSSKRVLLGMLSSLSETEALLLRFQQNLAPIFKWQDTFTWNVSREISLVVCTSIAESNATQINSSQALNEIPRRQGSNTHAQICASNCYNTLQLLQALSTIHPPLLTMGSSAQSKALELLQNAFAKHCMQPTPELDNSSAPFDKQDVGPCIIPTPQNVSPERQASHDSLPDMYSYSASALYLNITCQYPFVPVSSARAEKMEWLAGKLTDAACAALNSSERCEVSDSLLRCNIICEAVWFRDSLASGLLQKWLYVLLTFSIVAWTSSIVALVTFVRHRHVITSPARRTGVIVNLATAVYLLNYLTIASRSAAISINGACTADNSLTLGQPIGASACGFSGFRTVFTVTFIIPIVMCFGHSWYRLVVKLSTSKLLSDPKRIVQERQLPVLYLILALVLAALMSSIALARRGMIGEPPFYWCTVNPKTFFHTITIPYIIGASLGLIGLTISIPRLRTILRTHQVLTYHYSRPRTASAPNRSLQRWVSKSNSTKGLLQLLKLLTVYLITMGIHGAVVIGYRVPLYIRQFNSNVKDMDADGTRTHSMCLMVNRIPHTCPEIHQKNLTAAVAYHVSTICVCFVFTTWAYDWKFWEDVWPLNKFSELQSRPQRRKVVRSPVSTVVWYCQSSAATTPTTAT
eukprot:scpid31263/ scgid8953/ 